MAWQAFVYAAGYIEASGAHIRQDDVVRSPAVLEVTPELRLFLERPRQRYWYEWFAELVAAGTVLPVSFRLRSEAVSEGVEPARPHEPAA